MRDNKMKICVLSMQRVPNFGSVLQSYALKKILNSMGHNVEFLDIQYNKENDDLIRNFRSNFSAECQKGGFWSKLKKIDHYAINRILIKRKSNIQDKVFDGFVNNILGIADPKNNYDLCVIGSDEVFNCTADTAWGFTSQLFGNVEQADCVVTYAASCGSTKIDDLPNSVLNKIREAFSKISAFSVRDENTEEFVELITEKKPERHLDPVIIGDFSFEMKNVDISTKVPKRYCVVYSYYNRINKPEEIKQIEEFCRKYSLEIVSIGAPQMWIKNHLILTPFEALAAFEKAEFVVTDTFHGTIFSAKYAKRFVTISRPSNYNKMKSLISDLKIAQHYSTDFSSLEKAYQVVDDKKQIEDLIAQGRYHTIEYLRRVCEQL